LSLFIDTVVIDCTDPRRLAAFWSDALDHVIDEVGGDGALILDRVDEAGRGGAVSSQRVPEGKVAKNRVHLDLRPSTLCVLRGPDDGWSPS
jgi:hypothetical protein